MGALKIEKVSSTELTENYTARIDDLSEENDAQKDAGLATHLAYKGDDSDGKITWNIRTVLAGFSLSGLYTASQILVYFVGGALAFIAEDLGNAKAAAWIPTAYVLALAAVAAFVGYLQDLFGRRLIAIVGATLLCLGCVLLGTAHTFGQAVVAMSLSGAGGAIGELTALAGIAEIVPVRLRGLSVCVITLFIIPFLPFTLYAQLLSVHATWRWVAWLCLIYAGIVLVGIVFTYNPIAHPRIKGLSKSSILAEIDYVGGILSIAGIALLLVALQAAGYTHSWRSAYVLCQLLLGVVLISAFGVWEWKGAKYPMVPAELFQGQRIVLLVYTVAFVAGMSFFSFLSLITVAISTVYPQDPVQAPRYPPLSHGALAVSNPTNATLTTVLTAFGGFGCGGILAPTATIAMIVVPDAYLATAAALSISVRGIGGAIGYSIYYNIFHSEITSKLPAYVASYAIDARLPAAEAEQFVVTFLTAPANASASPGVNATIIEAATLGSRWAYAESLRYVWLTAIAFSTLAVICCVFVPSIRKYESNRIATQM